MIIPSKKAEPQDRPPDTNLVPNYFEDEYVQGALKPFLLSGIYRGERPVLPMIDLALSKEAAIPAHIFGMLNESWKPNVEEGTSVFLQGYENRGPNNERKKIYYSALTPDLYGPMYAEKIKRFLDQLFDEQNVDKPLMQQYYQGYFDMYWDLHLGVRGDDIPAEIKEIGDRFMCVIGYWYPILQVVHDNYMRVRQLRDPLRKWIDQRVEDVIDGKIPNPEKTFVYYWVKNDMPRKDIIFECFHNFLAFSQWGNTLYNIMNDLRGDGGDPSVRSWFEKTMTSGPDEMDNSPFTPLDRFVMELFRTISPNGGSVSSLPAVAQFFGAGYTGFSTIITPHPEPEPSTAPPSYHWNNPHEFDPDRYKTATTSEQNDESTCKEIGLARCPFSKEAFSVKDGRQADLTNSAFGAVYGVIDGEAYPVCDDAGYAPFGFGYRRCPGEFLTVDFVKDLLRKVWAEKIEFRRLNIADAKPLPVAPNMVVKDDIGFKKEQ
jgi:hypothetical protein